MLIDILEQIGGSLAKIVYFTSSADREGGRLHFKKIETEKIDECIDFIADLVADARLLTPENTNYVLKATGGGAYLFFDKLQERLPGVIIQKEDEMDCLINGKQRCFYAVKDGITNVRLGLNFFITEIPYEVFTYNEQETDPMRFEEKTRDIYPYMV